MVHNIRAASVIGFLVLATACSDSATGPVDSGRTASVTAGTLVVSAGSDQTATVGTAVSANPAVLVRDNSGAPVSGVTVTFSVASGGGSIANGTVATNPQGIAVAGPWVLGSAEGGNTLVANAASFTSVSFAATAVKAPVVEPTTVNYNITVRYLATGTARQQQAVTAAVARWQSVLTKDLVDIPMNAAANACFAGQPAINERVDDILIFVELVDIDGAGNVLGEAGPCFVRSDSNLPVIGHLKLDAADLAMMEKTGTLDDVVLHEVGHILGIGTLWPDRKLLAGSGTPDPRFTGGSAISAYHGLGGVDALVPVENTGSDGTRDGHWRESSFGNELMTGYISGPTNPMSALTIASLTDLGYGTNAGAASSYALNRTSGITAGIDLHDSEKIMRPKYKVDRDGTKTRIE